MPINAKTVFKLLELSDQINNQDNRATSHPIFVVEQKQYIGDYKLDIWYWKFVTVCFTEQSANEYIKQMGKHLREPRVYIYSGFDNPEWQLVREIVNMFAKEIKHVESQNITIM